MEFRKAFDELYNLGERVRLAVETDDEELLGRLIQERGELIDRLIPACKESSEGMNVYEEQLNRFREQERRLQSAVSKAEGRYLESLNNLGHVKGAHRSYQAAPMVRSILSPDVRG